MTSIHLPSSKRCTTCARALCLAAFAFAAVACATAPFPLQNVVDAQAAISAAEAVGAERVPKAQLHLKMARDQVREADRLVKLKQADEARWLLRRAQVDAELALALAREHESRDRLAVAQTRVDELVESSEDDETAGVQ